MKKPELLSPAGTQKSMHYAFAYGADAVYAGQPRYSLRVRNNEFNVLDNLLAGIAEAHQLQKKFLIASNVLPHNNKVKTYLKDLAPIVEAKPDALIMADPGLIMMVRETWPEQEIHLSVQMNTLNSAAIKFWKNVGIKRIILSRELGLEEIAEIREQCSDIELEVFVHGALCMAYSGRCLLSSYFNHRDANQGACTNACRWKYQLHNATQDAWGNVDAEHQDSLTEQVFLLQEETRPGTYMPVFEDECGTYIMNSKDLRAIQHVEYLTKIGIDCLKIEGRTKSYFYTARTAQLYRYAIDDAYAGRPFNIKLMDDLEGLSSRGYTEGFYRRHVNDALQQYERRTTMDLVSEFVGEVIGVDAAKERLYIDVKNRFAVGDTLELMTPQGNTCFVLNAMEDKTGKSIAMVDGSGVCVSIPYQGKNQALSMALLIRHKS